MELNVSRQELEDIIEFAETNEAVADALSKLVTVYMLSKENKVSVAVDRKRFKTQAEEEAQLERLRGYKYGL